MITTGKNKIIMEEDTMFFIIDIIPMVKILKTIQGTCDTCQLTGEINLIKTYQCLRLFFIPIFKWQVKYYLKHSCGGQTELTEEIALGLLYGSISIENIHMSHIKQNRMFCEKCGKQLNAEFDYCPYCGNKQG